MRSEGDHCERIRLAIVFVNAYSNVFSNPGTSASGLVYNLKAFTKTQILKAPTVNAVRNADPLGIMDCAALTMILASRRVMHVQKTLSTIPDTEKFWRIISYFNLRNGDV